MNLFNFFIINALLASTLLFSDTETASSLQNILEDEYKSMNAIYQEQMEAINLIEAQKISEQLELLEESSDAPLKNVTYTKVAILGNSSMKNGPDGFNAIVLEKLLKQIKKQEPKALFFTGNLVYGLKTEGLQNDPKANQLKTRNIFGRVISRIYGVYDSSLFSKQLEAFAKLMNANLGNIPFYPLPGEHESFGADAQEIFRRQFNIPTKQGLEGPNVAYSVPIDNAIFIMLGTDYFDEKTNRPVMGRFDPATLLWLNKTLGDASTKYSFPFVLGNDPAFSTESVFGYPQGIDQNLKAARQFWKALWKNHVIAYFSSNEILYDRFFNKGVWQIISGGAGASLPSSALRDTTFYHYILLSIPQNVEGKAFIEVFDADGELRDRFALSHQAPIIHEFRISND